MIAGAGHAEEIDVADGTLVVGAEEAPRNGGTGVRTYVRSDALGASHDVVAVCQPGLYGGWCEVTDEGQDGSVHPGVGMTHHGTEPRFCANAAGGLDNKEGASAHACVPGRAYPVPWGECAEATLRVAGAVDAHSERCLIR